MYGYKIIGNWRRYHDITYLVMTNDPIKASEMIETELKELLSLEDAFIWGDSPTIKQLSLDEMKQLRSVNLIWDIDFKI